MHKVCMKHNRSHQPIHYTSKFLIPSSCCTPCPEATYDGMLHKWNVNEALPNSVNIMNRDVHKIITTRVVIGVSWIIRVPRVRPSSMANIVALQTEGVSQNPRGRRWSSDEYGFGCNALEVWRGVLEQPLGGRWLSSWSLCLINDCVYCSH